MITASQWLGLARQATQLYWDSAFVIADRSHKMASGQMTAAEWHRMVSEKPDAFMSAMRSGSGAMMRGGSPAQVASAAVSPIGKRAGQNARRLRKN